MRGDVSREERERLKWVGDFRLRFGERKKELTQRTQRKSTECTEKKEPESTGAPVQQEEEQPKRAA
jgi:hypothetical protein